MKKLVFFSILFGFYNSLNAQIFKQDFNNSTNVSEYISTTPNVGQFNAISPDGINITTSIANGKLRFNRTGAASIYSFRNFTLATNPKFVQLKLDFEATNFSSGTQTPVFSVYIGSGFSSSSTGSSSNYTSRFGIIAQATAGEFKVGSIDNIEGSAPSSSAFTGKQTITFIVNNSGNNKVYIAPDGNNEDLANGKMDVWVGNKREINDFGLKNTSSPAGDISGIKIQATSASGNGIFEFDNIEFKNLEDVAVSPPTNDINLPTTPTEYLSFKHPFIWATYAERQKIVDNIHQFSWASSLYNQFKERVDAKKNAHILNPETTLKSIPSIPGIYSDRTDHTDILGSMTESAILYYLTNDTSYAQYAADILSHYMKYLAVQPVQKYQEGDDGLMFDDGWLESRALFPRIALTYDFLYNFLNNSSTTIYDLSTKNRKQFDDAVAQTTVANLADIVFLSIKARHSNHSVLAGNGALFNLLMISDDTKRNHYFNRFYNNTDESFDAYTWTLGNFTQNGVWPETFSYSKGSHGLVIQSLNVIDRYNPSLNLVNNHLKILEGFIGYANWFYPSDELMRFGDTGTEGDMTDEYRWILRIALRKNLPSIKQLATQNLKYYYNQKGGYNPQLVTDRLEFNSPLNLLWGENLDESEEGVTPNVASTYNLNHAGIVVQRNFNTTDIKNNGLMYYSGGAAYVHTHSTGIDLELYGKGQVTGAESGSSSYGSDEHENYRVRHAAHNTVIANGSGQRGGSNWLTKVANVELVAAEPASLGTPISSNFSFSTQYIDDSFNSCQQQRTNSIIRTSETTGYYFDIIRSKGKNSNNFHDYIYHNIGDAVNLKFSDDLNVPLSASNKYATDEFSNVTGWKFFENVQSSSATDKDIKASFSINSTNKYMNVSIPGGISREYVTALAPYTKGAINGYDKKKTQVITMRKMGEAWDQPFIAIYEPSENQLGSVKTTKIIFSENKVVGAKVVSEFNGQQMSDLIISNDDDNVITNLSQYNISFKGRFAVVRTEIKNETTKVSLYIGKGQELTFNGKTITSDSEGKAYLEYTLNYVYETPIPNNNFTIQSFGESCKGRENGKISINSIMSKNYTATLNGVPYKFTNSISIDNLKPTNYELCITIDGESYKQCYAINIQEGASISGKISLNNKMAEITIDKGTAPFTILKNGTSILETNERSFSLEVEDGDELKIKSNAVCQGELVKQINLFDKIMAFPNPSNGLFEIAVPTNLNSVRVEIYNMQSQLISSKPYLVNGGTISLDISNKPSGIYLVKLNLEKPVFVKLVKK